MSFENNKTYMALSLLNLKGMEVFSNNSSEAKELEILKRKREHLLKDKVNLQKEVKRLQISSGASTIKLSGLPGLKKYNQYYYESKFDEALKGYESLRAKGPFYSFLDTNIKICKQAIENAKI